MMIKEFGRDVTQLSRIIKFSVGFIFAHHKDKVYANVEWYEDRFVDYNAAICAKIASLNGGFIPVSLLHIFFFLDGTSFPISRPFVSVIV
jgi:hypothetical protein